MANKDLIGAASSVLLLSVISHEPNYGYEIVRRLNHSADGLFEWQEGTVYPLLHKLEKQRQLRSQWQDTESGRKRKYYYITARGRAAMAAEAEQFAAFGGLIASLLRPAAGS